MSASMIENLADPAALPQPNEVNSVYFEAAAQGKLLFQRCGNGHAFLYPRSLCPVCHTTELKWEQAGGGGELISFAPVYRPPWNDVKRPVPYVIVLVRLDEGPDVLSTLEGVDPDKVAIGSRVEAIFERVDEKIGLVRFKRVSG